MLGRMRSNIKVQGIAVAVLLALSAPSQAYEFWTSLYNSPTPRPVEPLQAPIVLQMPTSEAVCLTQIFEAQVRYGIPDNLLLAIGLQEAGRNVDGVDTVWPWTANAVGEGAFLRDKSSLKSWVRAKQASGIQSIDVGCMQVNLRWHGHAFRDLDHAMDPVANVDYAARFLLDLRKETGSWWEAAGRYHSATEKFKTLYLSKLSQNKRRAERGLEAIGDLVIMATADDEPTAAPLEVPLPEIHWSSDLASEATFGATGVHSIYTAMPLQSVFVVSQPPSDAE